jgi:hypothetical protein
MVISPLEIHYHLGGGWHVVSNEGGELPPDAGEVELNGEDATQVGSVPCSSAWQRFAEHEGGQPET